MRLQRRQRTQQSFIVSRTVYIAFRKFKQWVMEFAIEVKYLSIVNNTE